MTPISRALAALSDALAHVPVAHVGINADERQLLVTIPASPHLDGSEQVDRLLQVTQLAERLGLPEPSRSDIREPGVGGSQVQSAGTPAYAPQMLVVVSTPVTTGVREVQV